MRNIEIKYESVCPGIVYLSLQSTFILHDSNLHSKKAHFIKTYFLRMCYSSLVFIIQYVLVCLKPWIKSCLLPQ